MSDPSARPPLFWTSAGSGPAVLLIQGVGVIGAGWTPQIDAMASRFRTIAFDNRGIGSSALGDHTLTIEAMADDALGVMDAAGVDRFHVVGHSMGGLIAQQIALAAPNRVKSLALLCTFASGKEGSRMSPAMLISALRLRIGSRDMRRQAMLSLIMPEAYLRTTDRARLARSVGALFGRDLADQPAIVMKQLRALSRYNAEPRLSELSSIPALVISGAHDRIARPNLGRALAEGINGARYVEFSDGGHALTIQCAGRLNALLIEHIDSAEKLASSDTATVGQTARL
jgi:pimeloyl-ACP methyl ester carboxylesterase